MRENGLPLAGERSEYPIIAVFPGSSPVPTAVMAAAVVDGATVASGSKWVIDRSVGAWPLLASRFSAPSPSTMTKQTRSASGSPSAALSRSESEADVDVAKPAASMAAESAARTRRSPGTGKSSAKGRALWLTGPPRRGSHGGEG